MKLLEHAARDLLVHDGIVAVSATSPGVPPFAEGKQSDQRDAILAANASALSLYRALGLSKPLRIVLNEEPFGSLSIVTMAVDDRHVAVVVMTGHRVCKSLKRMTQRSFRHRVVPRTTHAVPAGAPGVTP